MRIKLLAMLVVLGLLLVPVGAVSAQEAPIMPQIFLGDVTIGGAPAPIGTTVSAWIEGVEVESVDTTTEGEYAIEIDPNDYVDKMVVFTVNGVVAGETEFLHPWDETPLYCDLVTYTLTVNILGAGTVDVDPLEAQYPSVDPVTVTLTAVPETGYGFDEWSGHLTGDTNPETLLMDGNKEVTAHFEIDDDLYLLTMEADPEVGGDAIDVDGEGAYPEGATVAIEADANTGWEFVEWTADPAVTFVDATAEVTTFGMPAEGVTVTANFVAVDPEEYDLTISVSPDGTGTTDPAVGTHTYYETQEVTVTASAATGYEFTHWSGDVTGTSPTIAVTMDGHKSITANFSEETDDEPIVGGTGYPANRLALVAPWIALAAVAAGAAIFARRRHAHS